MVGPRRRGWRWGREVRTRVCMLVGRYVWFENLVVDNLSIV
jgi:hypothetical protein